LHRCQQRRISAARARRPLSDGYAESASIRPLNVRKAASIIALAILVGAANRYHRGDALRWMKAAMMKKRCCIIRCWEIGEPEE
jgi:hypothetical protein